MALRFAAFLSLLAALTLGCSSTPPAKPDPVDVTLVVTLPNGQPAKDVTLNCFPTSANQLQGGGRLDANGKVTAKLTPGKYTYSFEGQPVPMKGVPAKYHQNDVAHTFDALPAGGQIDLKLSN